MTTVSIITPLHNKGPYVAETLASVKAQSMVDWDLIVVENHSTDDGPVQVERIAADDHRIRLICAPDSVKGPAAARNLGLGEAQGEWILFLDADDLLDSAYLETMLSKVREAPHADLVASPWVEFSDGANPQQGVVRFPAGYANNGKGIEDSGIAYTCWAIHAAIIRRSWLRQRKWPEELDSYLAEDTVFWFQVVCEAKIVYSDFSGAFYRTGTDNCRTVHTPKTWYEGNHQAVLANLNFMNAEGRRPRKAQMETLVRHYETLYLHAIREGDRNTEDLALACAREWLEKFSSMEGHCSLSMSLRQMLGIPRFRHLKNLSRIISRARSK